MTTQKAIEAITDFREVAYGHAVLAEALDMAIEALQRGLENVNADICSEEPNRSDLISRQDAIDVANRLIGDTKFCKVGTMSFQDGIIDGYCRMRSELLALPSAQSVRR